MSVWEQAEDDLGTDGERASVETVLGFDLPEGLTRAHFRDFCVLLLILALLVSGYFMTTPLLVDPVSQELRPPRRREVVCRHRPSALKPCDGKPLSLYLPKRGCGHSLAQIWSVNHGSAQPRQAGSGAAVPVTIIAAVKITEPLITR